MRLHNSELEAQGFYGNMDRAADLLEKGGEEGLLVVKKAEFEAPEVFLVVGCRYHFFKIFDSPDQVINKD